MYTTFNGEWVTDVEKMTCRNKTNNIVILFKKINGSLIGEIKTLPMKVVSKWAAEGLGNKRIKNAATEAQVIFFKAYFEKNYKDGLG
jgi:hypothetical protein